MTDIDGVELKRGDLIYVANGCDLNIVIVRKETSCSLQYYNLGSNGVNTARNDLGKKHPNYTASYYPCYMNAPRHTRIVKGNPEDLKGADLDYYHKIMDVLNHGKI